MEDKKGLQLSSDDLFRYIGKLFAELQKTNEIIAQSQEMVIKKEPD